MAYLTAMMTTALTSGIVTDHRKIVNTEVRTPIFISSNFDHKIFTMHPSDLLSNGLIVQTRHRCKRLFTSLPHVCKAIRISEYGKFSLVESRILDFGIRNTVLQESGIQVPLTKIWNPVPGVRNPQDGIQNPNLSWGDHQFLAGEWKSSNNAGINFPDAHFRRHAWQVDHEGIQSRHPSWHGHEDIY